jgi:hypothetical protein
MSDDFFVNPPAKVELKDQKTSIRNKYKRRLRNLATTLDDFIIQAESRLDEQLAGKIHKREEVVKLLESCKALRATIPVTFADEHMDNQVCQNLSNVFGIYSDLRDSDLDEGQRSAQ